MNDEMMNQNPTIDNEEIKERFPNVLWQLQAAYILDEREAISCLFAYLNECQSTAEAIIFAGGADRVLSFALPSTRRRACRRVYGGQETV